MKYLFFMSLMLSTSCAYHMGYGYKELPRGIQSVYIPIFKNDTMEVGPEASFTNQLVQEFKRAKVAKILDEGQAEGLLEGRIIRVSRHQKSPESREEGKEKTTGMVNLPVGTYVATEYLVKVKVELKLKKNKTNKVVWKQWFEDETVYSTARLALEGINTSNSNYTASEDQRVINELAGVMMREAVGRLTENF